MRGRPPKYKKAYCDMVIDTMAQGKSLARVAANLRIARSTLYEWAQTHPEFAEAIAMGKDLSLAHWEEIAEEVAREGKGNAAVLNFQMKNRFRNDYQDSTAVALSTPDPLQVEETHTIKFVMPDNHE